MSAAGKRAVSGMGLEPGPEVPRAGGAAAPSHPAAMTGALDRLLSRALIVIALAALSPAPQLGWPAIRRLPTGSGRQEPSR